MSRNKVEMDNLIGLVQRRFDGWVMVTVRLYLVSGFMLRVSELQSGIGLGLGLAVGWLSTMPMGGGME